MARGELSGLEAHQRPRAWLSEGDADDVLAARWRGAGVQQDVEDDVEGVLPARLQWARRGTGQIHPASPTLLAVAVITDHAALLRSHELLAGSSDLPR